MIKIKIVEATSHNEVEAAAKKAARVFMLALRGAVIAPGMDVSKIVPAEQQLQRDAAAALQDVAVKLGLYPVGSEDRDWGEVSAAPPPRKKRPIDYKL
tara:strand:- start:2132 stop:2425 length:294 start_codon:yes stop_codon:yes gene_type:complete